MKIYLEYEPEEKENAFEYARVFYNACKSSLIDVSTVAQMMLLEDTNEKNQTMYASLDNN
jgi:hypothetical protein